MNPLTESLFSSVPGVRCCDCPGCYLTMPTILIDGTTTNYANSTAATAAIADQVANCLFEARPLSYSGGTRTTFSASFTGGTLSITSDITGAIIGGGDDALTTRVYLTAAGGLSVVYNLNATTTGTPPGPSGASVILYLDDQTTVVNSVSGSPLFSGTFAPTIPADGYYWIKASVFQNGPPMSSGDSAISLSCTGGASFLPCYVRAAYDDGAGGTAYVICV